MGCKSGYEALAFAITMQAVEDYRTASNELELAFREGSIKKINKRLQRIASAQRYFDSGYCELLTGVEGRLISDNMDRITIPKDYVAAFQPLDKNEESEAEDD